MYRIQLQHKDFMVINKRPGIGMHDDAGEPGLVNRVRMDTGLDLYPVHRLDKMTSGLVLLARTAEANRALSMAFCGAGSEQAVSGTLRSQAEEEAGLGEG